MPRRIPNKKELQQKIKDNQWVMDKYFDVNFVKTLNREFLLPFTGLYFRPKFIGFENLSRRSEFENPLIYISNHSGMAFPWDAMIFGCELYDRYDYDMDSLMRILVAPSLSAIALMNPYMMRNAWYLAGGVDATFLNFETLMKNKDSNVLIFPEGIPGIGKGFNRKYQLQRFATSFVRMSLKHKSEVQPFVTINAEYINPYSYSFDWVNRLTKKIGIPFIPIGLITPFILVFPWLFYFAFPAQLNFVLGKRVKPFEWTDKPYDELSEEEINTIRDRIQVSMQNDLDNAVKDFGNKPYDFKGFFRECWKQRKAFPYYLPFMWPFLFTEFERQWDNKETTDGSDVKLSIGWFAWLKMMFKNPITLFYFIPVLGWIPLAMVGYLKKTGAKEKE